MTNIDRDKKNACNKAYYHRNKERLREKQRIRSAQEYARDPEARLQKQKKWREDNPEFSLFYSAKRNSVTKGVSFNLDKSDIIIPKICPVLGIKLERGKANWQSSPSIDRIIPSMGYIKGNIRVISLRANRIKFDASLEELQLVVKYLENEVNEIRNYLK